MFDEFNKILSENCSENSWYDEGSTYAEELLEKFSKHDWHNLIQTMKNQNNKYKIRLAYCIDEDTGMNGFNLLLDLLDESDEVAEYAIDSLRSFDKEEYKEIIASDKKVITRAEELLKNATPPVKLVLEKFLEQNTY